VTTATTPSRILVVDDDLTALLLMEAALRKAGYDVVTAPDGASALAAFGAGHFDLVMLDVDMPGMNGLEVCAAIRAEAGEMLPISMVTGMDDVGSVERAYDAGATDFIAKPIDWALIGHRVRYLLRGYHALLQVKAADARNAAVLRAIPDLVFEVDRDGRFISCHSPDSALLAAPVETFVGKTIAQVLPHAAAEICMAALRAAEEAGHSSGMQYQLPLAQGTRWFELSVSRKDTLPGEILHFIALARDVTERKEAEQRIMRLAYYDSLTGLPNRQSFLERVESEIQRARQRRDQFAVLFMDLDGFKNVNDSMGHATGDALLREAATRLSETLRPSDALSRNVLPAPGAEFARMGGDEFTALIINIQHADDAFAVGQRILHLMRGPFILEGEEILLSTSVGIAMFPNDGDDATTLLKNADAAMYRAKQSGRDKVRFYAAALSGSAVVTTDPR
jgi:diguanylate cyclase (GGDEF)-like protein/PAS domain S-box-containing protein